MKHLFTIASLLMAVACTSRPATMLPDGYLIAIVHSSGGPAPYMAWLGVYPNRRVVFRSAAWTLSRAEVDVMRFRRIQALLARPELYAELQTLTSRSAPYSDHEEVSFLIGEREFRFVCRRVAPRGVVLELLREVRGIRAYRLRDEPFAGAECTSELNRS